jgi:hypothetical protein
MRETARDTAAQCKRDARPRRGLFFRGCFGGAIAVGGAPDQSLQHDRSFAGLLLRKGLGEFAIETRAWHRKIALS